MLELEVGFVVTATRKQSQHISQTGSRYIMLEHYRMALSSTLLDGGASYIASSLGALNVR